MSIRHPWANCDGCPLNVFGAKFVGSDGPRRQDGSIDAKAVDVIVIGEAPGHQEVIERKPFIGPSGQLMRETLAAAGYDPSRAFYSNSVLCSPPGQQMAQYAAAVDHCRPRLERELQLVGDENTPILSVGKYAAQATIPLVCATTPSKNFAITRHRGKEYLPAPGATVRKKLFLTLHPAFILRVNSLLPVFQQDVNVMRNGKPVHALQDEVTWVEPTNVDDLKALLAVIPDGVDVAFDIETERLAWYESISGPASHILLLGFYWSPNAPAIIVNERLLCDAAAKRVINEFFQRVTLIAHNGKFDVVFLRRDGFDKAHVDFDTIIAHYMLQENPPHDLKSLASLYFYVKDYEAELVTHYFKGVKKADRNYRLIPHDALAQYLAWDVACTYHLKGEFERQMISEGLLEWPFQQLVMPLSHALLATEIAGIGVDYDYFEQQNALIARDIRISTDILRKISRRPTLNPNSWKQLSDYLWKQMGYRFVRSKHYADGSTSIAALQASELVYVNVANNFDSEVPFMRALLHYRRLRKVQSTYIVGIMKRLDATARVHPRYLETAAETGRLSAKDPPIQTIPRASGDFYGKMLRSGFVANPTPFVGASDPSRKRVFVMADYSQAELRVWAAITGDPYLLQVYREGRDLHDENTLRLYGPGFTKEQRTQMKNWVFAFVYGGDAFSFASQAKLPIARASAMVAEFEKLVPVAISWRQKTWDHACKYGYVQSVFGRKRRFPLINAETEKDVRHAAYNFPIQSAATDLNSAAHVELWRQGWDIVLTMHDSLTIECYEDEAEAATNALRTAMVAQGAQWFPQVPWKVDVDVVARWSDRPVDADRPDISDILDVNEYAHDDIDTDSIIIAREGGVRQSVPTAQPALGL